MRPRTLSSRSATDRRPRRRRALEQLRSPALRHDAQDAVSVPQPRARRPRPAGTAKTTGRAARPLADRADRRGTRRSGDERRRLDNDHAARTRAARTASNDGGPDLSARMSSPHWVSRRAPSRAVQVTDHRDTIGGGDVQGGEPIVARPPGGGTDATALAAASAAARDRQRKATRSLAPIGTRPRPARHVQQPASLGRPSARSRARPGSRCTRPPCPRPQWHTQ